MFDERSTAPDLEAKRRALLARALKHVRSAALAAALVPVAQVAVAPMVVSAQAPCPSGSCPPSPVPEPATLLLMAPAAAMLLRGRRKK